jgi:hypothetical protein
MLSGGLGGFLLAGAFAAQLRRIDSLEANSSQRLLTQPDMDAGLECVPVNHSGHNGGISSAQRRRGLGRKRHAQQQNRHK